MKYCNIHEFCPSNTGFKPDRNTIPKIRTRKIRGGVKENFISSPSHINLLNTNPKKIKKDKSIAVTPYPAIAKNWNPVRKKLVNMSSKTNCKTNFEIYKNEN